MKHFSKEIVCATNHSNILILWNCCTTLIHSSKVQRFRVIYCLFTHLAVVTQRNLFSYWRKLSNCSKKRQIFLGAVFWMALQKFFWTRCVQSPAKNIFGCCRCCKTGFKRSINYSNCSRQGNVPNIVDIEGDSDENEKVFDNFAEMPNG